MAIVASRPPALAAASNSKNSRALSVPFGILWTWRFPFSLLTSLPIREVGGRVLALCVCVCVCVWKRAGVGNT